MSMSSIRLVRPSSRTIRMYGSFLKTISLLITKKVEMWRSINVAPNCMTAGDRRLLKKYSRTRYFPNWIYNEIKRQVLGIWPSATRSPSDFRFLRFFFELERSILRRDDLWTSSCVQDHGNLCRDRWSWADAAVHLIAGTRSGKHYFYVAVGLNRRLILERWLSLRLGYCR